MWDDDTRMRHQQEIEAGVSFQLASGQIMAARITFAVPSPDRFRPDFPDMALMKYSHFFGKRPMIENRSLEKTDFNETPLADEYRKCEFVSCNFSGLHIDNTGFE